MNSKRLRMFAERISKIADELRRAGERPIDYTTKEEAGSFVRLGNALFRVDNDLHTLADDIELREQNADDKT